MPALFPNLFAQTDPLQATTRTHIEILSGTQFSVRTELTRLRRTTCGRAAETGAARVWLRSWPEGHDLNHTRAPCPALLSQRDNRAGRQKNHEYEHTK